MPGKYANKLKEPAAVMVARQLAASDLVADDVLVLTVASVRCPPIARSEINAVLALLYHAPAPRGRPVGNRLTRARLLARLKQGQSQPSLEPLRVALNERLRASRSAASKRRVQSFRIPVKGPRRDSWFATIHRLVALALRNDEPTMSGIALAPFLPSESLTPAERALATTQNYLRDGLRLRPPGIGRLRNIVSEYSPVSVKQGSQEQG